MRIGIVTLPLHTNYGGILQAYALKSVLEGMGHTADVLDRTVKIVMIPGWKRPLVYMKRIFLNVISLGKGPEVFRENRLIRELPAVSKEIKPFIDREIHPRVIDGYSDLGIGEYDVFIVGSDQVWRPKYFGRIEDAFLDFTAKWNVRRVSYAASFGTEQLEYSYEQLERCARLLSRFDAVSVRERSAVQICDEWFDCEDAEHVLDPVMLLDPEAYLRIASGYTGGPAKGKMVSYILDPSPEKSHVSGKVAGWLDAEVFDVSVSPNDRTVPLADRVVPAMEKWLAAFADAAFVVTDSFHGCVLSILFHKPFIVLGNAGRGMARIDSLLEMTGLEDRLVYGLDPDEDGEYYLSDMDWDRIDAVIGSERQKSMDFLMKSLNSSRKR